MPCTSDKPWRPKSKGRYRCRGVSLSGGVEHETSSFISEPTTLEDFAGRTVRGKDLARLGDANTIVDGFVKGVRECELHLVPLTWAQSDFRRAAQ